MDVMTKVNVVVMDKTGTLTKGDFKVQQVVAHDFDENELVKIAAALEKHTTHPVGKAIVQYAGDSFLDLSVSEVEEISGHGLKGNINGRAVLAGNLQLMKQFNVVYPAEIERVIYTKVVIAVDGKYAGYITIADELKEDAAQTIKELHRLNIKTVMLSGDKQSVVDDVAKQLGNCFG